jgi:hypothetical protein
VTAHTLPLLFGVDVAAVMGEPPATGGLITPMAEPRFTSALSDRRTRRIAIFRTSRGESMDDGWTRWVFDKYRVPFTTITEKDVVAGVLNEKFDAIVVPDQTPAQLTRALGEAGTAALGAFVDAGGSVLAFNDASAFVAEALKLPVKNVLEGVKNTDFYAPGSILGVEVNKASPLAAPLTAPVPAVWFEDSPAFEIADSTLATAVLTYPARGNALLSGWPARRSEAERQSRHGGRQARTWPRRPLRFPATIPRAEQLDLPADLGGAREALYVIGSRHRVSPSLFVKSDEADLGETAG